MATVGSPQATATSPSAPMATAAPKCTDSSNPLRDVTATGTKASGVAIGLRSATTPPPAAMGRLGGQRALDDLVTIPELGDERLHHRRRRDRQHSTHGPEHGRATDGRA